MESASLHKTCVPLMACSLAWIGASFVAQSADTPRQPVPPGYSTSLKGGIHDFDFLLGAWTTQQKHLKAFAAGSGEWVEAPANQHCAIPYLNGQAIVDQSHFPNKDPAGMFLFTFNPVQLQWAIRWVSAKTGEVDPPYVGGFQGLRGEFYGDDEYKGRPIRVRIIWTNPDRDHARWEQSFSYDDRTWEVNWVSDFTRADPTGICPKA